MYKCSIDTTAKQLLGGVLELVLHIFSSEVSDFLAPTIAWLEKTSMIQRFISTLSDGCRGGYGGCKPPLIRYLFQKMIIIFSFVWGQKDTKLGCIPPYIFRI